MIGVIYFLNNMAILRFFAPFLKSWLLVRKCSDYAWILVKLLSRFSSISNDSVMILLTSISSWFNLSRFSWAFISLNSFFFFKITRSKKMQNQWVFCHLKYLLTELKKSVLVLNSGNFWMIINIICWAICISKFVLKRMSYLL